MIEQAWVGQGILVGTFLALFWPLQPTSTDDSSSFGDDPSDASYDTAKESRSKVSSGVGELQYRQADLIRPASAASSIATTDAFQIEGGSEGSNALSTIAEIATGGS